MALMRCKVPLMPALLPDRKGSGTLPARDVSVVSEVNIHLCTDFESHLVTCYFHPLLTSVLNAKYAIRCFYNGCSVV